MSKKTSPQSRPARTSRSRGPSSARSISTSRSSARATPARQKGQKGQKEGADQRPNTFGTRLRRFIPVVAIPEAVIVLTILVLALGGLLLTATPLSYFPVLVGEMWLVTTLAPVVIDGVTVSFLPMLPAVGLIALLAFRIRRAIRAKVSVIDLAVLLLCVVAVSVLVTGIAWLMVWDAAKVYDVEAPPLGETMLRSVLVHLFAMAIGMGQRLWRAVARHYSVPAALAEGVADAWRFFWRLLLGALLVLIALLVVGWDRQAELLEAYPNMATGGIVALVALSIGYLPNALIAVGAVLLGSEFHIGDASVSLFSIHLVPLPPVPLAGVIPASAASWAPALLLITAALASWVMVTVRPGVVRAFGAAIGAALIAVVASYLGGGELGWYGATGAAPLMTAGLAAVWLGAIGLATAGALALTALRHRGPEQQDEPEEQGEEVAEEQDEPETEETEAPAEEAESAEGEEEAAGESEEPGDSDEPDDPEAPEEAEDAEESEDIEETEEPTEEEGPGEPEDVEKPAESETEPAAEREEK